RAQHQQGHGLPGADQPGLGDRTGQLVDVVEVRRDRSARADLREDDTRPIQIEIAVSQYCRNAHARDQSTGTSDSLPGCMSRYTGVPGACEMCGRQRARISCLPTATTWSTASPRNARVVTLPYHTFSPPAGCSAVSVTASGRMETTTSVPGVTCAPESRVRRPSRVSTTCRSPSRDATVPSMKFEVPMNSATNLLDGFSYIDLGFPNWTTSAARITAMFDDSDNASI